MAQAVDSKRFIVVGDNLSVDFVNTQILENGKPKDLLAKFEDFVAWANAVGLLESSEAERLIKNWSRRPEARKIFAQVQDFRRILREMVESILWIKALKPSTIKTINAILNQGYGYHELIKTEAGFEKRFRADFQEPHQLLVPIAESAADLISYGNPANLRKCESSNCILYFYDTTKNHRRRWCSMTECGNRAKAAAFYQRQRKKLKTSAKRKTK